MNDRFKILAPLVVVLSGFIVSIPYLLGGLPSLYYLDISSAASWIMFLARSLPFFPIWNPFASAPAYTLNPAFYPLLDSILYLLTKNIWLVYKLIQVSQCVIAGLCIYWMSYYFTKDRYIGILSAFNYMFMPFFLSMLTGHCYMSWGYTLLPFALIAVDKALQKNALKYSIAAGLVASLVTVLPMVEYFYLNGIFMFAFAIIRCFQLSKNGNMFRKIKTVFIVFITPVFISSYYVLPTIFEYFPYSQPEVYVTLRQALETARFYSYDHDLIKAFTLQYKEAMVALDVGYGLNQVPLLILTFYLVLSFLAFLSFLIRPRDKNVIAFSLVGLLSISFALGPATPLFIICHKYLPYFWVIRTPDRFLGFACLAFSFLSAFTVYELALKASHFILKQTHIRYNFGNRVLTILTGCVIALNLIVASQSTVFYHTFESTSDTQQTYPDLQEVQDFIHNVNPKNEYRVLDLTVPRNGNPLYCNLYSVDQRSVWNKWDFVDRFIDTPGFAKIIGQMNIRYVITSPNWSYNYPIEWPSNIDKKLELLPDFHVIYKSANGIVVWENKWALPRIYLARPAIVFGGPNALSIFNEFESYNPIKSPWALSFASQLGWDNWLNYVNESDLLIFHDSEFLDVVTTTLESKYVVEPYHFVTDDWQVLQDYDYTNPYGWLFNDSPYRNSVFGQLTLSNHCIYTSDRTNLQIPFSTNLNEEYEIWVRAHCGYESDAFTIYVDDQLVKNVTETKNHTGFRWLNGGTIHPSPDLHRLELKTEGRGATYIDIMLIAPASRLNSTFDLVADTILKANAPKLHLFEASHCFTKSNVIDVVGHIDQSNITGLRPSQFMSGYVDVFDTCNYTIGLHLNNLTAGESLIFEIDDHIIPRDKTKLNRSWLCCSAVLAKGTHEIKVTNDGRSFLVADLLYLLEGNKTLEDILGKSLNVQVDWREKTPNIFEGEVIIFSDKSLILVNTEIFSPQWKIFENSNEQEPLPVNYFMNGYLINTTEKELPFIVKYTLSAPRIIGITFTLLPFLALSLALGVNYVRKKKSYRNQKPVTLSEQLFNAFN